MFALWKAARVWPPKAKRSYNCRAVKSCHFVRDKWFSAPLAAFLYFHKCPSLWWFKSALKSPFLFHSVQHFPTVFHIVPSMAFWDILTVFHACSNYCIFEVFFMPVLHLRNVIWVKNNRNNRNYQTNQEVLKRKPLKIRGLFMFDFGWCKLLITGYFPTQEINIVDIQLVSI